MARECFKQGCQLLRISIKAKTKNSDEKANVTKFIATNLIVRNYQLAVLNMNRLVTGLSDRKEAKEICRKKRL